MAYSALSLAMLAAVFVAAERAPLVPLWSEAPQVHWLVLDATIAASLMPAFDLFRPDPLSFGGVRNAAFDPRNPALLRWIAPPAVGGVLPVLWRFLP